MERELEAVQEIIDAGRRGTPEIEAVIEREREQRWPPGRAEFVHVRQ